MYMYVYVYLGFMHCLSVGGHSVSKQQAIMPGQSYQLEDGSCSFKDFHGNRNNRFTTAEQAAKNRIQQPSNVLHFFNSHPDSSVESFGQVRNDRPYPVVLPSYCRLRCLEWLGPQSLMVSSCSSTDLRGVGNQESKQRQIIYRQEWVANEFVLMNMSMGMSVCRVRYVL